MRSAASRWKNCEAVLRLLLTEPEVPLTRDHADDYPGFWRKSEQPFITHRRWLPGTARHSEAPFEDRLTALGGEHDMSSFEVRPTIWIGRDDGATAHIRRSAVFDPPSCSASRRF